MSSGLPMAALKQIKAGKACKGRGSEVRIEKRVDDGPDLLSTCIFWGLMGYDI